MIGPHRIRPNETSRWIRRTLWLDTESRVEHEDSRCKVQTWRCAVTAYDGWQSHAKRARPVVWAQHETPADLWQYVTDLSKARERTVLVAHNLGYDLRIGRAFTELPKLGWALRRVLPYRENISCVWALPNEASLVMVDSHSWLPMSLAKVGELIGVAKPPDPDPDDDEAWLHRCCVDVGIMRNALKGVWDRLYAEDSGTWQKTGAGMAWSMWRHRFYTDEIMCHDVYEARQAELAATYAGRCEAWQHGNLSGQPWTEFDLSLAYTKVAATTHVPTALLRHYYGEPPDFQAGEPHPFVDLVRARVQISSPVLPVKTADGIVWPIGEFVGWWWDYELHDAELLGGAAVQVLECWRYRTRLALKAWAEHIIATCEDPEGADLVWKAVHKHFGRALIGKFGAKYTPWEPFSENPTGEVCMIPMLDGDTGRQHKLLMLGDRCLVGMSEQLGDDAFPAIQGAVMSASRMRLWRLMRAAGLQNVAYVDTDSLIVNQDGASKLRKVIGVGLAWGLVEKGTEDTFVIHGPRQYVFGDQRHFSGVPRTASPQGDGTFKGELWESAEGALSRNRFDRVVTVPTVWRPSMQDRRRLHIAEGRTAPYSLSLGDDSGPPT